VYAIASRRDLDWRGRPLADEAAREGKESELKAIHGSAKLYDWSAVDAAPAELSHPPRPRPPATTKVYQLGTQDVVELAARQYGNNVRIGWLDMANAHDCLGTYNQAYGGSQEEEVVPNSTGAVTLGMFAELRHSPQSAVLGEPFCHYREGFHIPAGGNYFARTRFVTSDPMVDCFMIATAFLDLRKPIPFVRTESQGLRFMVASKDRLRARLLQDIHGTLRTALAEGMEVLVLGASGCGAFGHDPVLEAALWEEALKPMQTAFSAVLFAILPDPGRPRNCEAFEEVFGKLPAPVSALP
jgi:hypothetical protein